MLSEEMLLKEISEFDGTVDEFLLYVEKRNGYIEAQVGNDDCITDYINK